MKTEEKKCSRKSGISLVVLLITIIVALILLSASTIKILDASENATLSAFAEELRSLEDSSKEYYLQNGSIPAVDTNNGMSVSDVLNLNNEERTLISEELMLNSDNQDTTKFYKLDLSKLNVTTTTRGVQKKGNERDIYLIAYPSFRVYYLDGVEAKKNMFFSLSSKMSGINSINVNLSNVVIDNANISNVSAITVKKDTEGMTSSIGVTISTNIENYNKEEIYVSLGSNAEKKLAINKNGFFSVKINNESEIYNTDTEKNNFNKLGKDQKYMQVIKKKDGVEIARVKVDLSNYDNSRPYIVENSVNLKKNSSTNTLYFDVSDVPIINDSTVQDAVISKIKEVRYEYLTKYNAESLQEENYYADQSDFSDSYMKSDAKKASISNSGTVKIDLPKEVTKIKIMVLDNASNYTIYEQTTAGETNIGYSINSFNKNYLSINLSIYSDDIVPSGSVLVSNDGINFTSENTFSDIAALNTKTLTLTYDNVLTFDNFVYLKIILNKNSGTEEKILKIDLNM